MQTQRVPLPPATGVPIPQMQEASTTTTLGIAPDRQRVTMLFSQPVPNMILTVEKAEEWIRHVQGVIDAIKAQPADGTKQ